jgi:hypothetical protein
VWKEGKGISASQAYPYRSIDTSGRKRSQHFSYYLTINTEKEKKKKKKHPKTHTNDPRLFGFFWFG